MLRCLLRTMFGGALTTDVHHLPCLLLAALRIPWPDPCLSVLCFSLRLFSCLGLQALVHVRDFLFVSLIAFLGLDSVHMFLVISHAVLYFCLFSCGMKSSVRAFLLSAHMFSHSGILLHSPLHASGQLCFERSCGCPGMVEPSSCPRLLLPAMSSPSLSLSPCIFY